MRFERFVADNAMDGTALVIDNCSLIDDHPSQMGRVVVVCNSDSQAERIADFLNDELPPTQ